MVDTQLALLDIVHPYFTATQDVYRTNAGELELVKLTAVLDLVDNTFWRYCLLGTWLALSFLDVAVAVEVSNGLLPPACHAF